MLKKTMIVMLSEFGRTPKINKRCGRDHHPSGVQLPLLAGGGVKGGQVIGSSDEDGVAAEGPAGQGQPPARHRSATLWASTRTRK